MPDTENPDAVAVAVQAPAPAENGSTLPTVAASGRHLLSLKCCRAFSEALFSTAEGPPPPERIEWLVGEIDALLERAGWRSGGFYKLTLVLTNFVAPLLIGIPLPLWMLTLEERVRAVSRLEHSALSAVVLTAKAMICIAWYEHPASAAEVGIVRRPMIGGAR